jgi:hypothetical protein
MGTFDSALKATGSGTYFFKTGAILRGTFENNLVQGKCLLTLPYNIFLVLRFKFGILESWSTKIDLNTGRVSYYKFIKGKFEEDREGEVFEKTLQETFKDIFNPNWCLDELQCFDDGDYFGSILLPSGQIFTGLIENGKIEGWGITISFQTNFNEGLSIK